MSRASSRRRPTARSTPTTAIDCRVSSVAGRPGAAVRLPHHLSIGPAVNVLAGLAGSIYAADGATRAIDARVDENVPTIARVIAGVRWDASPTLQLGAVYRQRFDIP